MDRTISAVELADALEPILCTTCHGFGDVRNAPCPTCKGAGLVARDLSLDERRAASDHLRRSATPAEVREVVERLKAQAASVAKASQMLAADKTARNRTAGDPEANYAGLRQDLTLEWQAATLLESLSLSAQEARNAALEAAATECRRRADLLGQGRSPYDGTACAELQQAEAAIRKLKEDAP